MREPTSEPTREPNSEPTRGRRRTLQPRAVATVALAWMLLWDRLSWGNLVNGVLVGLLVTLAFPLPSIEFQGRLRPHRLLWLITVFLLDLVAASWQVLRLASSGIGSPATPSSRCSCGHVPTST